MKRDDQRMALYLGATFVAGLLTLAHIKTSDLIKDHDENYQRFEQNTKRAAELYHQQLHLERMKNMELTRREAAKVIAYYNKLLKEERERHAADLRILTQPTLKQKN